MILNLQDSRITRTQFSPKCIFLKNFVLPSSSRPILSLRVTLYIKFNTIRRLFSRFRHFFVYKNGRFHNFFWSFTPKTPKNHLLLMKIYRRLPCKWLQVTLVNRAIFWPFKSENRAKMISNSFCKVILFKITQF